MYKKKKRITTTQRTGVLSVFFNLTKEMNVSVSKRETEKSRKH